MRIQSCTSTSHKFHFTHAATDIETMMMHTKYYALLSKVYMQREAMDESVEYLKKAKEMQSRWADVEILVNLQSVTPDLI